MSTKSPRRFRIPIALQLAWGLILAIGLFLLPESTRYWQVRERPPLASHSVVNLKTLNSQKSLPRRGDESEFVTSKGCFSSWADCASGSLWELKSNLRRTILGTSDNGRGFNFIFYYSTPFLIDKSTNAISNTFLISLIFTLINVFSTGVPSVCSSASSWLPSSVSTTPTHLSRQ